MRRRRRREGGEECLHVSQQGSALTSPRQVVLRSPQWQPTPSLCKKERLSIDRTNLLAFLDCIWSSKLNILFQVEKVQIIDSQNRTHHRSPLSPNKQLCLQLIVGIPYDTHSLQLIVGIPYDTHSLQLIVGIPYDTHSLQLIVGIPYDAHSLQLIGGIPYDAHSLQLIVGIPYDTHSLQLIGGIPYDAHSLQLIGGIPYDAHGTTVATLRCSCTGGDCISPLPTPTLATTRTHC